MGKGKQAVQLSLYDVLKRKRVAERIATLNRAVMYRYIWRTEDNYIMNYDERLSREPEPTLQKYLVTVVKTYEVIITSHSAMSAEHSANLLLYNESCDGEHLQSETVTSREWNEGE
jgi:hypothetical protein